MMIDCFMKSFAGLWITVCLIAVRLSTPCMGQAVPALKWQALPAIPDELGLAGPVVGVYDDILIVGGGANFARPVWENTKQWHANLYALDLRAEPLAWQPTGRLVEPLAYCACASTPYGVAVIGGNDDKQATNACWLLKAQRGKDHRITIDRQRLADLPTPLVYAQSVWLNDRLVVLSGQTGNALSTALAGGWQLKISSVESFGRSKWEALPDCPGGIRAFAIVTAKPVTSGTLSMNSKLLLIGGRRQSGESVESVEFLRDVWQYDIDQRDWQQLASLPVPVSAGGAVALGDNWLAVLSGDDGSLFTQTDQLKDNHPGFVKRTWLFDVAKNQWHSGGESPANQVTTPPVAVGQRGFLVSGEIRPRVRTDKAWEIKLIKSK